MIVLVKEIGKAFFIGVLIFIIVGLIEYANGYDVFRGDNFWERFWMNQLYSVVLYGGNMLYFVYLQKKYDKNIYNSKGLSQGVIGAVLISIFSIFLLRIFSEVILKGSNFTSFLANEKAAYYYISFVIALVVTFILYGFYYYRYKQESKVKEQKIIAGTASAKFDALKNQLDPHFLFNSLNVLTSLIEENPEAATRFTTALSKVYRYVLEQKNKELVTVEDELKFANLYMSLIKMRFEDSIVFTVPETISNPEAKVVPLALQLLLENAVKHNMVTPKRKLHITIEEKDGNLVITNNLQPKQVVKESTGVGLRNIQQRYMLLTDRPVLIDETTTKFSIAIPMLTKDTMTMQTQDTFISEKKYALAKEQVDKLKGFYIHFTIYLAFIPVFLYLNYISQAGFPWAIFPIGGWGFGILGHASETFNYNPFFGKDWEERKIRDFMDNDN
ncbi:2TM domain-containing protein [Ulvibacter antarcticus]|uniref:Histidine kinase n=1 Tax=Ulvibacter antarcticus TaxID=442714 RepID=A0A3L9ZDH5_9FLAO|nr:2TM domain-containing protein [Ulvibacter antarcticus]RMA64712.1 histidine kinase [Ulvibacter antarcticus]